MQILHIWVHLHIRVNDRARYSILWQILGKILSIILTMPNNCLRLLSKAKTNLFLCSTISVGALSCNQTV